jgi:hypothetical protein
VQLADRGEEDEGKNNSNSNSKSKSANIPGRHKRRPYIVQINYCSVWANAERTAHRSLCVFPAGFDCFAQAEHRQVCCDAEPEISGGNRGRFAAALSADDGAEASMRE